MVERLAPADADARLTLLWITGREYTHALARGDAVGILYVIEFEVDLGAVAELVAHQHSAVPGLRDAVVAEVVAGLAVDAYGPQAGIELDGQKEIGTASDQTALHRA